MRWGLPTMAIASLVGDLAARQPGTGIEDAFTAVGLLGALIFVGAGSSRSGWPPWHRSAVTGPGPPHGSGSS